MSSCPAIHKRRPALATLLGVTLSIFALVLLSSPSGAAPAGTDSLVFILDASASMATKVQGKPRMEAAKTVLSDLIADLPAGIDLGLVAFGHRQQDQCEDIEELAPLGPPDRQALIRKIQDLGPKGKAPIANALRTVAAGLKGRAGATTIVLVSDGGERCGGDPCAQVKELKASGARFVLHVVGLGVAGKERVRLACMAAAGGGTYFSATTAADLKRAMSKALGPIADSAGRLKVRALRNGQPLGAWYDLYAAGSARGPDRTPLASNPIGDQGEVIKLVPGTYDLAVRDQEDRNTPGLSFTGLTIRPGKTLEQVADFSVGSLTVKALRNSRPFKARYQLFRAGETDAGGQAPVATQSIGIDGETIELLPGTYDLVIEDLEDLGQPVQRFTGLVIEPGKAVQKTGAFAGGTLKVIARQGGLPVKARFEVFKPGAEGSEPQPIATAPIADEGQRILLPPGTYDLKVQNMEDPGNPVIDFPGVVVEAARTVERRADFEHGR